VHKLKMKKSEELKTSLVPNFMENKAKKGVGSMKDTDLRLGNLLAEPMQVEVLSIWIMGMRSFDAALGLGCCLSLLNY